MNFSFGGNNNGLITVWSCSWFVCDVMASITCWPVLTDWHLCKSDTRGVFLQYFKQVTQLPWCQITANQPYWATSMPDMWLPLSSSAELAGGKRDLFNADLRRGLICACRPIPAVRPLRRSSISIMVSNQCISGAQSCRSATGKCRAAFGTAPVQAFGLVPTAWS